jgi:SPP1 gp7 family putative phage head morphogenesis protein
VRIATELHSARGLPTARKTAARLRRLVRTAAVRYADRPADDILRAVRRQLARSSPDLSRAVSDGLLAGWLLAARGQAAESNIPPAFPPAPPLFAADPGDDDPDRPRVRMPAIEAAAEYLHARRLLAGDGLVALADAADRTAVAAVREATADAAAKIGEALTTDLRTGGTLPEFEAAVRDAIGVSVLADHRIEAVYRTEVGRAVASGQRAVVEHPLVADEFPDVEWSATHDDRVRDEHLMMERLGVQGTAVYRRDDPIWAKYWPPCGWNCRCVLIPMTLEDAAERGVREAVKWLRSGRPPTAPAWVARPPFDLPKGWVPVGPRLAA